jgi:hypothetical protein
MNRTALQIVPRLPPPPEGVGSFAVSLADALSDRHGIASRFAAVAADPGGLKKSLDKALDESLDADLPVLLHYAGYGYQKRGCPGWLADGLRAWRRRGGRRLVTVFHEVYASGPPWRSSFWLSPLQRRLAAEIARQSDGLVVSLEIYRRLLRRLVPEKEAELLPVFSTVGEPAAVPPLAERRRRLVVFGGPGARARAYGPLAPHLAAACRSLGLEEICDVGAGEAPVPAGLPVRRLGEMAGGDLSRLLLGSFAGLTTYAPPFLGKSTAFAAYCAHGLLPVCAPEAAGEGDPRLPPFWPAGGVAVPAIGALQETADRARAWYAGHAVGRHAARMRELLWP